MTEARVTRLTFDRGNAIDRVVIDAGGRELTVTADREVILCAGTINTAHLLQLSGIGAAGDLEPHGITIVTDLPGSGPTCTTT